MDCLFCKIIAGEIPAMKVYEDERVVAFLDIHPVNPGHTLVVPRVHSNDMTAATDEILAHCIYVANRIGKAVLACDLGTGFQVSIHTRPSAGQTILHTHIHVMPRKENDGYKSWIGEPYAEGAAERVATQLRGQVN